MLRLLLHAGPERLAIPAAAVTEVLPAVERHPLAGGPGWLAGAVRVRGAVVPVVDLCRLVGGRDCPMTLHARIVVVGGAMPFGLLAERVGDLREVAESGGMTAPVGADGVNLGPLATDVDGLIRLTDPATMLPPGVLS